MPVSSCAASFERGERYLVFAHGREAYGHVFPMQQGELTATACSGSHKITRTNPRGLPNSYRPSQ
jgi:hypothetical protein